MRGAGSARYGKNASRRLPVAPGSSRPPPHEPRLARIRADFVRAVAPRERVLVFAPIEFAPTGTIRVGVLMVRQAIERAGVRGMAVGPFRETGAAWERRPIGTKITGVSRAQRSASRRRVVRCRPGIVTHTTFAKVPEQRRTASLRSRCTASGTRNVLILAPMERRPRLRAAPIKAICHPSPLCSLRLAAQDVALSRRKQGFESPRERQRFQYLSAKN